jgi:spore germination cell wall hydrolase CwlJ-like protein
MMLLTRAAGLFACALAISMTNFAEAKARPARTDLTCLAQAIYFEARGESAKGQLAVGRVVLNRVKSRVYPDTICGVVFQNEHRRDACQFSFACDGKSDQAKDRTAWKIALARAEELISCKPPCQAGPRWRAPIWKSMFYHADYVSPRWAKKLNRTGTLGRHIFYATA